MYISNTAIIAHNFNTYSHGNSYRAHSYAHHYSQHFTYVKSFNPHNYYYPHFTDED